MPAGVLGLIDEFQWTAGDRLVASAVVALGFLLLVWSVRAALDWFRERIGRRVANVGASALVLSATVACGYLLLRIWQTSPAVRSTLGQIEGRAWLLAAQGVLTFVLLAGVYLVSRVVRNGMYEFADGRQGISRHQIEIAFRTGQVVLYVFALIVVLSVWGVNLGGLLVGAGFLGIVVGMAARQTLGALLAGFVLMFSRPFEIGDWIEVGDKEGVVTDITIVNTRIQTFDGEYVMVPNDLVASQEVVNRSRKGRLRLTIEVGVDYDTDVDHAIETATEALGVVDHILSVPQPQVVAKSFGDSAIVLECRVWIDKPSARRKWRARTAVVREVKSAFDREGITIPFPQRTLSDRDPADGRPIAEGRVEAGAEDD